MKPFTQYMFEMDRKYEFVVRIAGCDMNEDMKSKIQHALNMYVVENMGAAKRLPVQEYREFAGMGPCEVHMFEVTLKYPTITPQIRQIVAEKLNIAAKQIVVRTRLEEDNYNFVPAEPSKAKDGSILSNPNLEAESAQAVVGHQRIDSMLKELQSRKFEFAKQSETAKSVDMPQGEKSPVGSNPVKKPTPKGK